MLSINEVSSLLSSFGFVDIKEYADRMISSNDVNEVRGLSVLVDCKENIVDVHASFGINGFAKGTIMSGQRFEDINNLEIILKNNFLFTHYQPCNQ